MRPNSATPFSVVQRIWRKHGVRPHRLDIHIVSNDPAFETKAADVIGLYLQSPAHAAVLSLFAALNTGTGEVLGKDRAAPHQRAVRRLPHRR